MHNTSFDKSWKTGLSQVIDFSGTSKLTDANARASHWITLQMLTGGRVEYLSDETLGKVSADTYIVVQ